MSTTVVTNIASYQIGVDILGFPVYHEHYFAKEHISECSTKKQGKNMSKNKITYKVIPYANSTHKCNFLDYFLIEQIFRFFEL